MKRNTALLEKTMQYINDHPEQHDQFNYFDFCGTPLCFAGWAIHLAGHKQQDASEYVGCDLDLGPSGTLAIKLLGLTEEEGAVMFGSYNTRPMLELMVKDLVNGDELLDWAHYKIETTERSVMA